MPGDTPMSFDDAIAALDVEPVLDSWNLVSYTEILGLDAVRAAHRAEVERAVAERDGARQEAERWRTARRESEDYIAAIVKATGDTWTGHIDFLAHIARLAALSARVARLEAALRFYADRDNWIYGEDMDGQTFAVEDCGDKARAALEDKP